MADKIRLGFIGAGSGPTWAKRSHLPALQFSEDFELTAVCTTKPESAEEARQRYGAKLAFHDFREMVVSPEIDAVSVVVRVPSHYEPTMAALEAGKHVYTEWPLGRTTAEAEELAALARSRGVVTAIGLQARVSPPLMFMKELIESGQLGEVTSCHLSVMRQGVLGRTSDKTWMADDSQGANTLTIASGHALDTLRNVVSQFASLSSLVTTQTKQWLQTDTGKRVDVSSPDNVMVNGRLENGAVASVHVGLIPWAGSGFRMEVYGTEGTLVATGNDSPMLCEVTLQGAFGGDELSVLEVPSRFVYVPAATPPVEPFNVGQNYCKFAEAIRTGNSQQPTFATAVELHHLIDTIRRASETGQEMPVA